MNRQIYIHFVFIVSFLSCHNLTADHNTNHLFKADGFNGALTLYFKHKRGAPTTFGTDNDGYQYFQACWQTNAFLIFQTPPKKEIPIDLARFQLTQKFPAYSSCNNNIWVYFSGGLQRYNSELNDKMGDSVLGDGKLRLYEILTLGLRGVDPKMIDWSKTNLQFNINTNNNIMASLVLNEDIPSQLNISYNGYSHCTVFDISSFDPKLKLPLLANSYSLNKENPKETGSYEILAYQILKKPFEEVFFDFDFHIKGQKRIQSTNIHEMTYLDNIPYNKTKDGMKAITDISPKEGTNRMLLILFLLVFTSSIFFFLAYNKK